MKKLLTGTVAAVVALLLMGGTASAHFCTNASRSEKGSQQVAANSQGWLSIDDFLAGPEVGLCEDGVAYVLEGLEGTGYENLVIHGRTVMAQGLHHTNVGHLLDDGRGVEHLTEEDFAEVEAAIEPLIGEAFALCG